MIGSFIGGCKGDVRCRNKKKSANMGQRENSPGGLTSFKIEPLSEPKTLQGGLSSRLRNLPIEVCNYVRVKYHHFPSSANHLLVPLNSLGQQS